MFSQCAQKRSRADEIPNVVAANDEGEIVALGNVFPEGPIDEGGAEIAVIVDDRWHRRGLGREMLMRLVDVARRVSFDSLTAYVLYDNQGMVAMLSRLPLDWQIGRDGDLGASVLCMRTSIGEVGGTPSRSLAAEL